MRHERIGIVIIGRNEGDRLRRSIESVLHRSEPIVYVDSGSSDGSPELARGMDVDVVELDQRRPFSAARARNEGFNALLKRDPDIEAVQFIDGDCELHERWLDLAWNTLENESDVAIVCGQLRERTPEQSLFKRLCQLEWISDVGDVRSCGGICMVRVSAFRDVHGFNPRIVAGEEPELCVRLRTRGWRIVRLADEMATHDAGLMGFTEWWKRARRSGQAFAECADRHRDHPERPGMRETYRNLTWGIAIPAAILALAWPTKGLSTLGLLAYPLLAARIAQRRMRRYGEGLGKACLYATFCILAKLPGALGAISQYWRRRRGRPPRLIEYKRRPVAIFPGRIEVHARSEGGEE